MKAFLCCSSTIAKLECLKYEKIGSKRATQKYIIQIEIIRESNT